MKNLVKTYLIFCLEEKVSNSYYCVSYNITLLVIWINQWQPFSWHGIKYLQQAGFTIREILIPVSEHLVWSGMLQKNENSEFSKSDVKLIQNKCFTEIYSWDILITQNWYFFSVIFLKECSFILLYSNTF